MKVFVKLLSEQAKVPSYATTGSAGADLCAAINEPLVLAPRARAKVPTGIAIELPTGEVAFVCPRSGLAANHGVTVLNAPGIVDSDFRGEVCVLLINHGTQAVVIEPGERIAQLVVPGKRCEYVPANELSETERGAGGFGHTGR